MNRKIFNYSSVILEEKTLEVFGYHPKDLSNNSSKLILASCRWCGKPHKLSKKRFVDVGSACHKDCHREEMRKQESPFCDPQVRERARKTCKERWGSEHANQNKEIAQKISEGRKKAQSNIEKTNLKKYGIKNPFQDKEKIKQSYLKKYGVDHPLKNDSIKDNLKKLI